MSERLSFSPEELKKESENPKIYSLPSEEISCNKKHHAERSIVHQPNHLGYWKKRRANQGETII